MTSHTNDELRRRFARLLGAVAHLPVRRVSHDFSDAKIVLEPLGPGYLPSISVRGFVLSSSLEIGRVIEELRALADALTEYAAGDDNGRQNDDDQEAPPAPPAPAAGAPPPAPHPPVPPPAPNRRGRPPGSRNKPKAQEPAPPETESGPGSDWHGPTTTEEPSPPPASTPVHDEPQAQLPLPNPLPVPPDLATPDVAEDQLEDGIRWLLERLEQDGGSGDPRGWAGADPASVGAAVARKLVRPLGGVEGTPVLLRLTDLGWAELERGRP